jgi:hypothetical protein
MPTLVFPEREALRLALASGRVPAPLADAPANAGVDDQGRLWLTTDAPLTREALAALAEFGVRAVNTVRAGEMIAADCWPQLVPLEPSPAGANAGPVLFDLPGRRLAAFLSEVERLGGGQASCRWRHDPDADATDDRALVRVTAPPLASVLRAADSGDERAYAEQEPGVWVAVGWRHPLAGQLRPAAGKLLLLRPPHVWEWCAEGEFRRVLQARRTVPEGSPVRTAEATLLPVDRGRYGVALRLRLVPDPLDAPAELWLIRDDALAWLARFVRGSEERLLSRFAFAVVRGEGGPCVVLRVRNLKEPPPVLVGLPAGYRPLLRLVNLFAPCGLRLEPPPRRDTLRRLLAPDAKRLSWLLPRENGTFRGESVPLAAFRPLTEWVEYRNEEAVRHRRPWRQAEGLTFERFRVAEPAAPPRPEPAVVPTPREEVAGPPTPSGERPARQRKRGLFARAIDWFIGPREEVGGAAEAPTPDEAPLPAPEVAREAARLPRDHTITPPKSEETRALKARFLASLSQLTPQDRLALWPELGAAFAKEGNAAESAACWLNAVWEQEAPAPAWAWAWLKAEAAQAGRSAHNVRLAEWLGGPTPPRAVAAYAVWAALQKPPPADFLANLGGLSAYLDEHEAGLPVRAAWLARAALGRLTRGDVLSLARTRDRLLDRLHVQGGLSLDLDAPAFVRFGANDPDQLDRVRKWLAEKHPLVERWVAGLGAEGADAPGYVSLANCGLEAEVPGTRAYADLLIAWGLTRLGEKADGTRLRDRAWQALDGGDPVHAFLKAAFDYRIGQAREGRVAGGPLPDDLHGPLDAFTYDQRYAADRLRQASRVLDPSEQVNPYWATTYLPFGGWDPVRKQLEKLPALGPAALNERAKQLLAKAAGEAKAALPAVLKHTLDLVTRLDPEVAAQALGQVPAALDLIAGTSSERLRLLQKGLLAAAYLQKETMVQRLANDFARLVEEQRGLPVADELPGLTGQIFRCLRRFGLRREANAVLGQVHGWLTRGDDLPQLRRRTDPAEWPRLLQTLLHVAAGWYYCGQEEEGFKIVHAAGGDLYDGTMPLNRRTELAYAYAAALGQVPPGVALGRFTDLFTRLKRVAVNGINTHYTLQPLRLIDTVVLAVVSDDFTLGPAVRGWLDDEEYLVRRRVHQDLRRFMEEQGVG